MSTGARCGRPGCDGMIEDGYCDTCGMAERTASAGSTPAAASQPAAASRHGSPTPVHAASSAGAKNTAGAGKSQAGTGNTPARCTRPGCTGTIEDGYCDTCGMAAAPSRAAGGSGAGGASVPSVRTGSTRTGTTSSGRTSTGRTRGSAVSLRTATSRTGSTRGSRSTRGGLGLGLVEIPQVEYLDPSEAVLSDPQVPEHKRYCSNCSAPVGRSRDGRPGRTNGFCAKCGGAYDFAPKLAAGDVVNDQYEVLGCIAHGGLGWIYLARDNNVSGRWVALKGLLDTGDADARAAAAAERRYLAEAEHPNVVKIYNFIRHGGDEYIVMEYVGGKSLKQIALDYKESHATAPLPLEQVLAYAIEILPAFGYLHSIGLLYCDFKPDNVIQSEEQLKLIDMGAVRAFDDEDSAVYGTVGYQAPEIAEDGPTVESDLYTVGRAMAVLSFDFKGFTSNYATSLPPTPTVPLLVKYESFERALHRATSPVRTARFSSAAEMAAQLTGVLREVLAIGDGQPRPAASTLFTGERIVFGLDFTAPDGRQFAVALPIPLVDPTDPNAAQLASIGGPPSQVVEQLNKLPHQSTEVVYRLVRAEIERGGFTEAATWLDLLQQDDAFDWRVSWYRGLLALAQGDPASARQAFDACYSELPGELAPKLALAAAAEAGGDPATAERYYKLVWTVDRAFVSAGFALARLRTAAQDVPGAIAVLGQVPESSIHRTAAELAAINARLSAPDFDERATAAELASLAARVDALGLDGEPHEALKCSLLMRTLSWIRAHTGSIAQSSGTRVFSAALTERDVRLALESSYRARARMAPDRASRIHLVDEANSLRPRTLI